MNNELKSQFFRRLHIRESWLIFFTMGMIMMNYPFIHIFHKPLLLIIGMPVLFLYLYGGWLVSIVVIYLFVTAIDLSTESDKGEHR